MTAMDSQTIVMTVQATDDRAIQDNGLNACISRRLQGAGAINIITGGAMTLVAPAGMKGINAIGAFPSVGE